jgi:flagellar biosynthesis protein FlhG
MKSNRLAEYYREGIMDKRRPHLVSLLSGKGGVGKSTIAFNLAATLAEADEKCLLIDTDWYFGNQHILANVTPQGTLLDVIANNNNAKEAITEVNNTLHLIASPSGAADPQEFEAGSFAHFAADIRSLFRDYDFIIFDTPSGLIDLIRLAAGTSDTNIIVINPELTSISDSYGLFKYLANCNKNILVHLLINRVTNSHEHEYIYQKLAVMAERFLGILPNDGGYLLEDDAIVASVAQQKPLIGLAPASPAMDGLLSLRNLLRGERANGVEYNRVNLNGNINSQRILADIKE